MSSWKTKCKETANKHGDALVRMSAHPRVLQFYCRLEIPNRGQAKGGLLLHDFSERDDFDSGFDQAGAKGFRHLDGGR